MQQSKVSDTTADAMKNFAGNIISFIHTQKKPLIKSTALIINCYTLCHFGFHIFCYFLALFFIQYHFT